MTNSILKSKKMLIPGVVLLLALGAAFAYFTDRVETHATVSTGENPVDITINPEQSGTLSEQWAAKNAEALANFNPGDKLDLGFDLKNTGSTPVDVRESFLLTSSKELTQSSPEYRLFLDAVQDAAGAWAGTDVVSVEQIDAHTIKYSIAPYVISSESEAIGNNPVEVAKTYNLVFDKAAQNAFQGTTCTVDFLLEAKQHTEDGPNGGWDLVESATVEIAE